MGPILDGDWSGIKGQPRTHGLILAVGVATVCTPVGIIASVGCCTVVPLGGIGMIGSPGNICES